MCRLSQEEIYRTTCVWVRRVLRVNPRNLVRIQTMLAHVISKYCPPATVDHVGPTELGVSSTLSFRAIAAILDESHELEKHLFKQGGLWTRHHEPMHE